MKVWVAIISHKHGVNVSVSSTEAGVRKQVYDYVQEWWNDVAGVMGDGKTIPDNCPKDRNVAIPMYFDNHPNNESCTVEEIEVVD